MSLKEVWGDVSGYETYSYEVEATLKSGGEGEDNNKTTAADTTNSSFSDYSVEIRKYAPRVAACSTAPKPFMIIAGYIGVGSAPQNQKKQASSPPPSSTTSSDENSSSGGGDNEAIAMTTPVVMSNPSPPSAEAIAMTTPVVMSNNSSNNGTAAGNQAQEVDDGHNTRTFKNQHQEMAFMLPAKYTKVEDCPVPSDSRVYLKQVPGVFKACHQYSPSFWSGDTYEQEAKKLRDFMTQKGVKMLGEVERHGYNPPYTLFNKRTDVCVNIEWPSTSAAAAVDGSSK